MRASLNFWNPTIHLINPMENFHGGSEHRTLGLYRHLEGLAHRQIWSHGDPCDAFSEKVEIKLLRPRSLRFPISGTIVFVSSYFAIGRWLKYSFPERIVIICNLPDERKFWAMHQRIREFRPKTAVSVAYASDWLRQKIGIDGPISISPVDLERFAPRPSDESAERVFTIGRLSRDVPAKHHKDDVALYKILAGRGIRIRIMGGTCLTSQLERTPNIELLHAGQEPPEQFLKSLDVFFYRTSTARPEPHGRVVTEALCTGIPVVASPAGGVGEWIKDGENGFSITDNRSAINAVLQLASDPDLRVRLSKQARETSERVFSSSNVRMNLCDVLGI